MKFEPKSPDWETRRSVRHTDTEKESEKNIASVGSGKCDQNQGG